MFRLGGTINCFPPLTDCIVFSGTMKAGPQEGGFQAKHSSNNLSSVSSTIRAYLKPQKGNQGQNQQSVMSGESLELA